jgi:CBS domain-containing protein
MSSQGTKKRKGEEAIEIKDDAKLDDRLDPEFIQFLLHTKAEDFAIDRPKKDAPIFVCYRTDRVVDVWRGLVKHNFLSCPVVLKDERYFGFLDMADIVKYVINHFGPTNILGKEKDFWDLVDEEKVFATKTVNDLMTYPLSTRNPFHPVKEGYSALAVMEPLAREENLHRVPVIDKNRKFNNLVTQSQVVDFLAKNLHRLGGKANKLVKDCQYAFKPRVLSVTEDSIAIDAFYSMVDKGVSGLAVTDGSGVLRGNLSLRDLKLISYDARLFWRLQQTVGNFLLKLRSEYAAKGRPTSLITATEKDTIGMVIRTLSENQIHRIYIVDNDKKAIGLLSLQDVLLEIIS